MMMMIHPPSPLSQLQRNPRLPSNPKRITHPVGMFPALEDLGPITLVIAVIVDPGRTVGLESGDRDRDRVVGIAMGWGEVVGMRGR